MIFKKNTVESLFNNWEESLENHQLIGECIRKFKSGEVSGHPGHPSPPPRVRACLWRKLKFKNMIESSLLKFQNSIKKIIENQLYGHTYIYKEAYEN